VLAMEAAEFVLAQIRASDNHTHLLPKSEVKRELQAPISFARLASRDSFKAPPSQKGCCCLMRMEL
jgi:hypothetical protein